MSKKFLYLGDRNAGMGGLQEYAQETQFGNCASGKSRFTDRDLFHPFCSTFVEFMLLDFQSQQGIHIQKKNQGKSARRSATCLSGAAHYGRESRRAVL